MKGLKLKKSTEEKQAEEPKKKKSKKELGLTIGIILAFVLVAGVGTGGFLVHLSDTSPEFCATCHVMERNVTSYLTSNHLDNVHNQANVQCKDCHDYPVVAEVSSGVNYLIGNYSVGTDGELLAVKYSDDMCLQCHISDEFLASSTDYLERNPHDNHNGDLDCSTCHISHGEQINYCSSCHDNGGQRMIEEIAAEEVSTEVSTDQ